MPILETEEKTDILQAAPEGLNWIVVHARPRCEKKVERVCDEKSMTSYLPLRKKTHTYGRRKREFESPLFPGYVFCIVDIHQRSFLRQNRYVANILDVIEQEKLVGQLNQVHRALAVGDVLEVRPYLVKGTPVMVKNGPFKGMEGVVERVKGQTRVVLNVDMIQQGISFEIDAECLVPA